MSIQSRSRESILFHIRLYLQEQKIEHPQIPLFRRADSSLASDFQQRLQEAGGASCFVSSVEEAVVKLHALHPDARVVCSAASEITGTRNVHEIRDPHELADVDVGVLRARFGVAENGAIWLTQEDLVIDALAFLSQHLVVLLDPEQIIPDMHEAYRRVELNKTAFGCFMMGPSATADVEATLVHGAQGARSLNIFFLPPSKTPDKQASYVVSTI
jgi:L-lactate dehydrogenase complex protein LldG